MVAYRCRSRTSEEYLVRRLALKSAFGSLMQAMKESGDNTAESTGHS